MNKHIALPDLKEYHQQLKQQAKIDSLKVIPSKNGLVHDLPKCLKKGWPWDEELSIDIYRSDILWPKISVVMPSYNQANFIEEAIRSVLLQNYPNLEFIVIDGGSTDNTLDILEKYSFWLSYWHSKKDRGQGHAINMGFSLATGDYFGWLNSDDFYNKSALFHLGSEIFKTRKEFYYGDAFTVNEGNTQRFYWRANLVLDRYLRFGGLIASHSAFWSKTIHTPIWEKMNCNVDGELWLRLVKNKSRKHIPFPIGSFRIQKNAKTSSDIWKEKWAEDDHNIEAVHGPHNTGKKALIYEYKYFQKLYKLLLSHGKF